MAASFPIFVKEKTNHMYPDLSYILHDLIGTPVDNWTSIFKTFGICLAIALFSAGYVTYIEFKRKEDEGLLPKIRIKKQDRDKLAIREAITNGLLGLFVGLKLPYVFMNFESFKQNPAGAIFSLDGNWLFGILGAGLFGAYYYYTGIKNKTEATTEPGEYLIAPHQKVGDLMLLVGIMGVIGARLFSVLENWDDFVADPIGQLFSGSGLTVFGGLIVGFIAGYIYIKRLGLNPIHMIDVAGPGLIMGSGMGRFGCHFAGDGDWGIVNNAPTPSWWILPDWVWAYDYPRNVLREGISIEGCEGIYCNRLAEMVYPTPIYEITMFLIIFIILWVLRKRIKIAGLLFFIYMIFAGIERFLIEGIRVNPRYELIGLDWSLSQWIAVGFFVIGVVGIIYILVNKEKFKYENQMAPIVTIPTGSVSAP